MADTINISLPEVKATADTIRSINTSLASTLEEIGSNMDMLSSTWESDGSEAIREAFKALQPRFEEYKSVVDTYATFLDDTVEKYTLTETAITNSANDFK